MNAISAAAVNSPMITAATRASAASSQTFHSRLISPVIASFMIGYAVRASAARAAGI